jgi:hypothetical protein
VGSRNVGATAIAAAAGSVGFGVILLVGYLLSGRLWAESPVAAIVVTAVFGTFGLYAGWILGVLVFSSVRGLSPANGAPTKPASWGGQSGEYPAEPGEGTGGDSPA